MVGHGATMKPPTACTMIVAAAAVLGTAHAAAASGESWFVPFQQIQVSPVARADTTQLVEAGTIETDGFRELVFSFGGEFKEGTPQSGRVGAILIPDQPIFEHLLLNEGRIIFPLEVTVGISPQTGRIFVSEQIVANVAFPAYRVYMYNETSSGASVSLFVYRRR
jgi:hypothetical protein